MEELPCLIDGLFITSMSVPLFLYFAFMIFYVTMRHRAVCVRPLMIFYVLTAAKLLSAHVRSDMLPLTHGTVQFPVPLAIVTVCVFLNHNSKPTYLNKLLLTVHISHIVIIAPTNSFVLRTASYMFYLLT